MPKKGWISVHRELLDRPIWKQSTPEQKTILITLLLMADHEGNEWEYHGQKYKTQPGQFVTSLPSIVEECGKGVTIQNVRTALKRFEKLEFLTDKSTKQNRLITIVNWGLYQDKSTRDNRQSNSQLTDDQQTPNSQLTANNNGIMQSPNKEKNESEISSADIEKVADYYQAVIRPLSPNDFNELKQDCKQYGLSIVCKVIQEAGKRGVPDYRDPYRWITTTLIDWNKKGLMNVEQIDQYLQTRPAFKPKNTTKQRDEQRTTPLTPQEIADTWI